MLSAVETSKIGSIT